MPDPAHQRDVHAVLKEVERVVSPEAALHTEETEGYTTVHFGLRGTIDPSPLVQVAKAYGATIEIRGDKGSITVPVCVRRVYTVAQFVRMSLALGVLVALALALRWKQ